MRAFQPLAVTEESDTHCTAPAGSPFGGPEVPQYFTPLTVNASYWQLLSASTSKTSTVFAGGKQVMVQPLSFG